MAALVCDLCGGKLIMGAGGIAVCDSCGMEHSADRMKEKVQEIKGTVRVDNSHMIENYLVMALRARDADNKAEVESYCNKILEIEPTNYKALMLKGEVVAWQSTSKKSRVDEGVAAFIRGINYAPDDLKDKLVEEAKNQIKDLAVARISLRADRFAKWPDKEEANGFVSDIRAIFNTVLNFSTQTGDLIPISEITEPCATLINHSVVRAWNNVIWPDYNGDPNDTDDRAGKHEWQKFLDRVSHCTTLVEMAINLCNEDDENDISRYENLIYMHKQAINSCAWDYDFSTYGDKMWHKRWQLADSAKEVRHNLIRSYEAKIKAIKEAKEKKIKEETKKRVDKYWSEHADEKVALETERDSLQEQISLLQTEISNIPGSVEKLSIQRRINTLSEEKDSLGIFKGKEKKIIQEKIEEANQELKNIVDRMESDKREIEKKIEPLQNRVNEINTELTKER